MCACGFKGQWCVLLTGPYLAPSAIDFVSDASIIPSLYSTQSKTFTSKDARRNDLALAGAVQRKKRHVHFAVSEKLFRH